MTSKTVLMLMALLLCLASAASAGDLAREIDEIDDGYVHFYFESREGVRGDCGHISTSEQDTRHFKRGHHDGDDEWDDVLNVNLKASFKLSKAVLRPMMKARHGRIINITSVVGTTGNAGQVNYAASKAGTVGMSKSMAQEVASRGITVNCVAPGFIATPMTDVLDEKQREAIMQNIPISRLGNPEEIAASVLYLASDEAAYVTGQTLHVNGGMAMI